MVPIDLVALLKEDLEREHKPRENLYPSSDLIGSLRHTQLKFVGAPEVTSDLVSDMRMETGTMWHKKIGMVLEGIGAPVMREVKLTPWMPEGWSGVADLLFWVPEQRAFWLRDVKTTKGEGIKWKLEKGISEEHLWQVSSYWWGCYHMGLRMLDRFDVAYMPLTQVYGEEIEPAIIESKPLPEEVLLPVMKERWEACTAYRSSLNPLMSVSSPLEDRFVTDALAPIQPRVQKLVWDAKPKRWNVILVPHWSASFCPFPSELCSCSQEGTTKVGHWQIREGGADAGVEFVSRPGYAVDPTVMPQQTEIRRRFK